MTEPVIRSIPLDRLERSPANVRRTEAGKGALAELKASIAAHGLLENLVVRSAGPGGDPGTGPGQAPGTGPGQAPGEHYAVIAGARRLAALNDLAREGAVAADHPVPCRVIENGVPDTELSLAENVVRVAMHPADQVQAFGALALAGASVADIAARFGISERIVEQRLRLGSAAPELLDAYRDDRIDLETLKAFAVTTDRQRQLAVWERVRDQGYRPTAWQIKRMLTEDRVPADSALARFVGVEAYVAAGGPVLRDLFADEREHGVWLEDPALLTQLAMDRLQVLADELATRWKWAEARLDVEWSDLARFGRVRPTPVRPTGEEQAEIERLHARRGELADIDEDAWTEELEREGEAIEARLAEIEAAVKVRAVFRPEDIAISGCIVTVGNDGTLGLVQGLVRPEDVPADTGPAASGAPARDGGGQDDGQQAASGIQAPAIAGPAMPPARPDPEAAARKEAGVGIGLADDLRASRTALVKAHLAADFGAAFDLALFQMGRAVFASGYRDQALDIAVRETPDRPPLRVNDDAFGDWSPGEAMLADRSSLRFDWLEIDDDGESFAALRALPEVDKEQLFAACVARTVKGQLAFEPGARPELEATIARLDIDFAAHVRPTAGMFWSRIRKDRMLSVAREVLGVEWAHAHRKDKKAALAAAMETAFAKSDPVPLGITKEGHAAALAWAPPGLGAFDTGTVGDEAAAPPEAEVPPATRPSSDAAPSDEAQSDVQQGPAAEQPDPAGGGQAPEAPASDGADAEPTAPPRRTSVVERIVAPAVAERVAVARSGQEHIDAMNAVPVAEGDPGAIVAAGTGAGASRNAERPDVPGNGHDTAGDALEIPAFLRRS